MVQVDCGALVYSIDLSGDQTLLATGDGAKKCKVWDVRSGRCLQEMTCGHNVFSVKLSVDTTLIATGDAMSKAKVWDTASGALRQTFDCAGWVHCVYFSGDACMLATGDQGKQARLWNATTGELVYALPCESEVLQVDLSRGKRMLTLSQKNGTVAQYHCAPGRLLAAADFKGDVNWIDLSEDYLVTAGPGAKVTLSRVRHDGKRCEHVRDHTMAGSCFGVDLSADGTLVAAGDVSGKARVWATGDGMEQCSFFAGAGPVFTVKLASDNSFLATGNVRGIVCLWSLDAAPGESEASRQIRTMDCSAKGPVRCVDLANNDALLASGSANGDACVWDVEDGTLLRTVRCGGMVYSVDLSAQGDMLATGDQHKKACVWDVATGGLMCACDCGEPVKRVDFSADHSVLAVGAGNWCMLWDVASAQMVERQEFGGRVKLCPDKKLLASVDAAGKGIVRLLLEPEVGSFWAEITNNPSALSAASGAVPSYELLLHGSSPSGRTLVGHAAQASIAQHGIAWRRGGSLASHLARVLSTYADMPCYALLCRRATPRCSSGSSQRCRARCPARSCSVTARASTRSTWRSSGETVALRSCCWRRPSACRRTRAGRWWSLGTTGRHRLSSRWRACSRWHWSGSSSPSGLTATRPPVRLSCSAGRASRSCGTTTSEWR